jgi:anti-sigma B factor antagonist
MTDPELLSTPGLRLQISTLADATVVQCHGSLTFENSDFVKREVKTRIPEKGRLVLDLSAVTRMDSSGLGTLVGLYLSARSRRCDFDLINLNKQIRDLLSMSNLLSVFETCGRHGIRMP